MDDARAAHENCVRCVLFHTGRDALHARGRFDELSGSLVKSLPEAILA